MDENTEPTTLWGFPIVERDDVPEHTIVVSKGQLLRFHLFPVSDENFPEVARFAKVMHEKLVENAHKPGWKDDNPFDLLIRLYEETKELRDLMLLDRENELVDGDNRLNLKKQIAQEAADVANFAMMIADVFGGLKDG